ncbi:hypothetical protein D3C81_2235780 [compost metagenome]
MRIGHATPIDVTLGKRFLYPMIQPDLESTKRNQKHFKKMLAMLICTWYILIPAKKVKRRARKEVEKKSLHLTAERDIL